MCVSPKKYKEQIVVAKKKHVCSECYGTIEKGEKYEYVTGVWENWHWKRYKTCSDCQELREKINSGIIVWDEKVAFTELYERVADYSEYRDNGIEILQWFWEICLKRGSYEFLWMGENLAKKILGMK